jgi:hypothetical protein
MPAAGSAITAHRRTIHPSADQIRASDNPASLTRGGPVRILPDVDPRRVAQYLMFIIPASAAVNYATQGEIAYAGICILVIAVLFLSALAFEVWTDKASYYQWHIAASMPLNLVSVLLLVLSGFALSNFFDEGSTLFGMSDGLHVLLCIVGLVLSLALGRRSFSNIQRLTWQSRVPTSHGAINLAYAGPTDTALAGEHWSDTSQAQNQKFDVTVRLAPFVKFVEVEFVALERLDEHGREGGLVWVGSRLAFLRPLIVAFPGENDSTVPVNIDGSIRRLMLCDGAEFSIHAFSDEDSDWFSTGSTFRLVIYLRHGGFLLDETRLRGATPGPTEAATPGATKDAS